MQKRVWHRVAAPVTGLLALAALVAWAHHGRGGSTPLLYDLASPATGPAPAISAAEYRRAGALLDPQLLAGLHEERNRSHATPCWLPEGTHADDAQPLACLPAFLVLGGTAAGSQLLYGMLSGHGEVAALHNPRLDFWTSRDAAVPSYLQALQESWEALAARPARALLGDASDGTFAYTWYAGRRAHRAHAAALELCAKGCQREQAQGGGGGDARKAACMAGCPGAARAVDAEFAAELAANSSERRGAGGQPAHLPLPYEAVSLPLLVRAAYGPTPPKLLVVLRDPAERLHAAYWRQPEYTRRYGATPEGFLAYARQMVAAFQACAAAPGHSPRGCALHWESLGPAQAAAFRSADELLRSLYWVWLEGWQYHFGGEAEWGVAGGGGGGPLLHVLFYEDLVAAPRPALAAACHFLGIVPPTDNGLWRNMSAAAPGLPLAILPGSQQAGGAGEQVDMLPAARQLLDAFFAPHNRRLGELLGLGSASPWRRGSRGRAAAAADARDQADHRLTQIRRAARKWL